MTQPSYNVGWGLTSACNLKCKHCYNSSGGLRGKNELDLDKTKKVVDKLLANGVKTINYGTGESGLVPEFWELTKYVHSKWIIQGLTTNGWSVNKNTIGLIKKYFNDIDVSLDFPNKEEHNQFRGSQHSWNWATTALKLLKQHEIDFSIVVCLTAKNCSQENLDRFLTISKQYGCDLRINWFRPTGRGKTNHELKLNIDQVNNSFIYLVNNSVIKALPDPYFSALLNINSRIGCPCGKDSFRITPTGKVVPCVYFTNELENINILSNDFNDIINSQPFLDINNRQIEFCQDCEYHKYCRGGCASRAYLEFGSMNEPDAFCYKKAGLKENPFQTLNPIYHPGGLRVHENYLCTIIVGAK